MKDKMTATLPTESVKKVTNYEKKEVIDSRTYVVRIRSGFKTPLTVRFYMGRSASSSRVYCSFWLYGKNKHYSASAYVDGCGYHKKSAAFQAALDSAGIGLSNPIDGRGDTPIDEAMGALVRALGYRGAGLVVTQ
jgi:hypothetical protein